MPRTQMRTTRFIAALLASASALSTATAQDRSAPPSAQRGAAASPLTADVQPRRVDIEDVEGGRRAQTAPRPSVRVFELVSAPYVDRAAGPAGAGRIVGSGEVPGIPLTESERKILLHERVFVTLPEGRAANRGDRYAVLARGPELKGLGRIMIPTGIVAVERAQPGLAVEAEVMAKFGEMLIGHELVPLNTNVPPSNARPAPISGGPTARVVWINGEPELPTLQFYVVIDAGSGAGIRPGDQITFYRPTRRLASGVVLPESDIGVAQVVRVGERTSTAIIIDQSYPAIHVDTPVRVTAKMP